jgi:hypothetical protein
MTFNIRLPNPDDGYSLLGITEGHLLPALSNIMKLISLECRKLIDDN